MSKTIYMSQTIQLIGSVDPDYVNDLISQGITKKVSDKLIYLIIEETDK